MFSHHHGLLAPHRPGDQQGALSLTGSVFFVAGFHPELRHRDSGRWDGSLEWRKLGVSPKSLPGILGLRAQGQVFCSWNPIGSREATTLPPSFFPLSLCLLSLFLPPPPPPLPCKGLNYRSQTSICFFSMGKFPSGSEYSCPPSRVPLLGVRITVKSAGSQRGPVNVETEPRKASRLITTFHADHRATVGLYRTFV